MIKYPPCHFKNKVCEAVMIVHGYPPWLNEGLFKIVPNFDI